MGARRRYADRVDAGRAVARALTADPAALGGAAGGDLVVLGLPRGGVPVAASVAEALGADLDVLVVRKLGVPWQPELAMGAVAAVGRGAVVVREGRVLAGTGVAEEEFARVRDDAVVVLAGLEATYRAGAAAAAVRGRTAVVVDDGLATGSTARAALEAVRAVGPARVVLAVPVAPARTCAELAAVADAVVCPWTPRAFTSVGSAYRDFSPTPTEEVVALLRRARGGR